MTARLTDSQVGSRVWGAIARSTPTNHTTRHFAEAAQPPPDPVLFVWLAPASTCICIPPGQSLQLLTTKVGKASSRNASNMAGPEGQPRSIAPGGVQEVFTTLKGKGFTTYWLKGQGLRIGDGGKAGHVMPTLRGNFTSIVYQLQSSWAYWPLF